MKKNILLIYLACLVMPLTAQWTQTFENLQLYKVSFKNIQDSKQADYLTLLITDCNNVLICCINEDGTGNIFAEGEINMNEITNQYSKIPFVEISDISKAKSTNEDYFDTYIKLYRPALSDISQKLPPAVYMKDEKKQSRAHSVFKTIWMQKYPDTYNTMFPEKTDQSDAEKNEKAIKETK